MADRTVSVKGRTMKRQTISLAKSPWKGLLLTGSVFAILAGCGDDSGSGANNPREKVEVVSSIYNLGDCTDEMEGDTVFVKDKKTDYVCQDREWNSVEDAESQSSSSKKVDKESSSSGVKDKSSSSVTADSLSSSSVVVMDTTNNNENDIVIKDKSISGVSQKGPFVNGSSVTVQELDGKTLAQTGKSFKGKISNDKGEFAISSVTLASQYAILEASGYYRKETSGNKSSGTITLNALTDLSDRKKVNINLLTHLEYERALYLVGTGLSVEKAKKQAETEIFKVFSIEGDFANSEDLDIFSEGDGNAALLAISVLMLGNRSEADLTELLTNFATDIEKDGKWDDDATKTKIADWAASADLSGELADIRKYIQGWNLGDVPDFEKYVRNFWYANYGLGVCSDNRKGEVLAAQNEKSTKYNTRERYICKSGAWVIASDIEKDTYGLRKECSKDGQYGDGTILEGRVNADNKYVCDAGEFREAESTEIGWNKGCVSYNRNASVMFDGQYSYYKCSDKGWVYDFDNLNSGIITDSRDNKKYKTIGIKTQMWMAENLDFVYEPNGISEKCSTSISGFWNWTAHHDKLGIGTTMVPDSGASPLYIKKGVVYAEASMEIGPEPEWTIEKWDVCQQTPDKCELKYPFAGITMYFNDDKKGVDFKTLGIKSLRVTMKASGAIRMSVLNEKTVEEQTEPGVYMPKSTGYVATTYDLTPDQLGFRGFADDPNIPYNTLSYYSGVPSWADVNNAPTGDEILTAVKGLKWELKDGRGGAGEVSIKAVEFLDASGNVVPPNKITGTYIECYDSYTNTDDGAAFGRYYTWGAAMDGTGVCSTNSKGCGFGKTCSPKTPVQGVCPEGWHLPSSSEWDTLYSAMESSPYAMQAKGFDNWNKATDKYGFSALPAGYYSAYFNDVGSNAGFWSASEYGDGNAHYWYLDANRAILRDTGKGRALPIRCVRD